MKLLYVPIQHCKLQKNRNIFSPWNHVIYPKVHKCALLYFRHELLDEVPPIIGIHRIRHLSGTRSISSTEDMFLLGQKIARGDDAPVRLF